MGCSTAETTSSQFKAERKQHRNRWADFINRIAEMRDRVLPGDFGRLYSVISPYSMMSHARLRGIYDGVCHVNQKGVPGDLVECGTARGGCATLMGLTCKNTNSVRRLWVFDTFEGLPSPTKNDPDYELAKAREGDCRGSLEEVRSLLDRTGISCEPMMIKGLFQDTVPKATVREIAFLHLDGDWYDSTMVCLEHLYEKVSPGGIIQIDDYGHWAGARKALHEFLDTRELDVELRYLDYSGRQFVKPN